MDSAWLIDSDDKAKSQTNGANGTTQYSQNDKPIRNGASTMLPPRHTSTGVKVLIVGSGPGGLMSALECWRKGHDVIKILERSDSPVLTGDIMVVQPSAIEVLRHWPQLVSELKEVEYDVDMHYKKHSGEHIYGPCKPSFNDAGEPERRQGPYTAALQPRIGFFQMLLRQVQRIGVEVEYGARVERYFEDIPAKKGGVIMENGKAVIADVVVAADGQSTASATLVSGSPVKPKPSGMAIYRVAFSKSHAFQNEIVREQWKDDSSVWQFWLGPKMYCGIVVHDDIISWGFTPRDDGTADESWTPGAEVTPDQAINAMGNALEGWHPAIPALVRMTPKGTIVHSRLMWRDLRKQWTSPGGHVVQVGDSAHSFLPTSGNGATQSIEDAVTLATCLQLAGKTNAGLGTKIYNLLRYERVACAQKMTFVNSQLKQETDWKAIEREPAKIRTRFPNWVTRHDPEAYAYEKYGQAFAHLTADAPFHNTNFPPGHKFVPWSIDEIKRDIESGVRVEDLLDGDWS
ncbi:hypothetical protein CKM354_001000600 [Cercospora kikuchii]|uniref:FAD-binding domain-containing protein n=1 Tax=Cercospora kikuchii TaxID=84275 RepID=A0A9P3CW73_9PEZI|nr:uncharacterized protein CKM354_001000600 [Cercospora kikuchii]GIZ46900.1 hypothetical protein CKM354_001000600 [Cercospora kikuchii]